MKKKKTRLIWFGIPFIGLIFGILGWQLYSLINKGVSDLLSLIGVDNFYIQGFIVLGILLGILILIGYSLQSIFKKLGE